MSHTKSWTPIDGIKIKIPKQTMVLEGNGTDDVIYIAAMLYVDQHHISPACVRLSLLMERATDGRGEERQ
jgi:hypothetical protein